MNTPKQLKNVIPSPWLDDTKSNCFRDQFRLIKDLMIDSWLKDMGAYFTPIELLTVQLRDGEGLKR